MRTKALHIFKGTELEKKILVKSTATAMADLGNGILAVAAGNDIYYFKGILESLSLRCLL